MGVSREIKRYIEMVYYWKVLHSEIYFRYKQHFYIPKIFTKPNKIPLFHLSSTVSSFLFSTRNKIVTWWNKVKKYPEIRKYPGKNIFDKINSNTSTEKLSKHFVISQHFVQINLFWNKQIWFLEGILYWKIYQTQLFEAAL